MANNNLTITQDENGVVRVCRVVLEPVREFATVLEACEFVGEEQKREPGTEYWAENVESFGWMWHECRASGIEPDNEGDVDDGEEPDENDERHAIFPTYR